MNKPRETPPLAALATPLVRAEDHWKAAYAAQIGDDRPVLNRSGIPIEPL